MSLTLDVDPEAWQLAYGTETAIKEDVKSYVVGQINDSPANQECGLLVVRSS